MSYMITSDTNLDLTCGARFLTYNRSRAEFAWTTNPLHAWRIDRLADAEDHAAKARAGTLRMEPGTDAPEAMHRAEVIPAMEQTADGEWMDGTWDTEDAQGRAL